MDKQELLAAIKEGKDYDYIANNHTAMSKSDLADAYKELSYSIYTFLSKGEFERFTKHYSGVFEDSIDE